MQRVRTFFIASTHFVAAPLLIYLSLFLVKPSQQVLLPAGVALFVAFPILIMGGAFLYFGGYRLIPPVFWVFVAMPLGAAALILLGTLLV